MKNLLVASTSTLHGGDYLDYLLDVLSAHFASANNVLFIPYARPGGVSHDQYTANAQKAFSKIGKQLVGIHSFEDPIKALENAAGIFTGGGNTFVLVSQLYQNQIMAPLREVILEGIPYLGTSAGSNICGLTMQTTNDMPIVHPPSFKTLGVVPFNINPHYLDPDPDSKHMGETRETRIKEFHSQNNLPVLGLREGSWLEVKDDSIMLKGTLSARVFEKDKPPYELAAGSPVRIN
ncbi:MAG TPA: dipeptidase PepE [Flavobacteriaceae bacterium]|nr:dipeptidase PepE [Flavobacteriaceae bacterium]MCB9213567.1 dipeptidase PepE [Alteromonas sp.]HPF12068.1 dipeptidase PepE [Flavobacteriaceae bacterium]HQU21501.1 dipeptidase PepE [Flavobacteriaceae bacterium]HQU65651.1 dipeptidase PepE [Flavobacteriaceae bacterium]